MDQFASEPIYPSMLSEFEAEYDRRSSNELAIRLDERIRTLREVLDITADHDFPTAHQKIVKLLEQAKAKP